MKILRFLGVFMVLSCAGFAHSYAASTSASGFGTQNDPVCDENGCWYCDDASCYNCNSSNISSSTCQQLCNTNYYGMPWDNVSCQPCFATKSGAYGYSEQSFNRVTDSCFKTCNTSCQEYNGWGQYLGIHSSRFTIDKFYKSNTQLEFSGLQGADCNMGTNYCPYNVQCTDSTISGCKPGHIAVEFRDEDGNLIKTYYTVNRAVWSTQNTQWNSDPMYSGVVYPVFVTPIAAKITGKTFIGWCSARSGGNVVIAPASADAMYGNLTYNLASSITSNTTLYACYSDDSVTYTITLDRDGGSGGPSTIYYRNGNFYSDSSASTQISTIITPTKQNWVFDGYHSSDGRQCVYYDGSISNFCVPRENTTWTAHWAPEGMKTIQLSANGGTPDYTIYYKDGTFYCDAMGNTSTDLLSTCGHNIPTWSDHTFNGYANAETNGTIVINDVGRIQNGASVTNNTTWYAQWTENEPQVSCKVSLALNPDPGQFTGSCNGTFEINTDGTLPQLPNDCIAEMASVGSALTNSATFGGYEFQGTRFYTVDSTGTYLIAENISDLCEYDGIQIELTAIWNQSIKCDCGWYVPRGETECRKCEPGSYCPGSDYYSGDFTVPVDYDQGIEGCYKGTGCANATSDVGACTVNQCYILHTGQCTQPNANCPTNNNQCDYQNITASCKAYITTYEQCDASCTPSANCPVTSCPVGYWYSNHVCHACNTGYTQPNNHNAGNATTCKKECSVACDTSLPVTGCPENATCSPNPASNTQYGTTNQTVPNACYDTNNQIIVAGACGVGDFECNEGFTWNADTKTCEQDATYVIRGKCSIDAVNFAFEKSLAYGEEYLYPNEDMQKVCPNPCGENMHQDGYDVYYYDPMSWHETVSILPTPIVGGVTYGEVTPVTFVPHCADDTHPVKYMCYIGDTNSVDDGATLTGYTVKTLGWYQQNAPLCNINSNNFSKWLFSGDQNLYSPGATISPWTYGDNKIFVPGYSARFNCSTDYWTGSDSTQTVALGDTIRTPNMGCTPRAQYAGWVDLNSSWKSSYATNMDTPVPDAQCIAGGLSVAGDSEFTWNCPTDLTFRPDDQLLTLSITLQCAAYTEPDTITVTYEDQDNISTIISNWFINNCHGGPCTQPETPQMWAHGYMSICANWGDVVPEGLTPDENNPNCYLTNYNNMSYDFSSLNQYWNQISDIHLSGNWICPKWVNYKCDAGEQPYHDTTTDYLAYLGEEYTVLNSQTVGCGDYGYDFDRWVKENDQSVQYAENQEVASWPYDTEITLVAQWNTCPEGTYWDESTETCLSCAENAVGYPYSKPPYNWSINQCYRECPGVVCTNTNTTSLTSNYGLQKFVNSNNQIDFYGNSGMNTCENVTYCPYVVTGGDVYATKVRGVPVNFIDSTDTNVDTYHVVGSASVSNGNDVNPAFLWSQIVGPAQKYHIEHSGFVYDSVPIVYPVYTAPYNELNGFAFTGYYNPRNSTRQYVPASATLNQTNAQDVVANITANADLSRDLYAHYDSNAYDITYETWGATGWVADTNHPDTYTVANTPFVIDGVPTRGNNSIFVAWCDDAGLTQNCASTRTIPAGTTGNLTFYAKWNCGVPYVYDPNTHQCTYCEGANTYWDADAAECRSCAENASGYPLSNPPYNWSINQCYRECVSTTCTDASTTSVGLDDYWLEKFLSGNNRQVDFYGNHVLAGINACENVTYCPYVVKSQHGDSGGLFSSLKVRHSPVNFYDNNINLVDTYHIVGRLREFLPDVGTAFTWSQIVGPAQKYHYEEGLDIFDAVPIVYPVYTAPHNDPVGFLFDGYYNPRVNGTQYVNSSATLNRTNAQNIVDSIQYGTDLSRNLYAYYSADTYTITYNCGTATGGTTPGQQTDIHYGDSVTPRANTCTKPGYNFLGWMVSNSSDIQQPGIEFQWAYTENKTFTAKWSDDLNQYTITYKPGYSDTTQSDITEGVAYSASFTTKPAGTFTRSGYRMTAWEEPFPILNHIYNYNIEGDTVLRAQWEMCTSGTYSNNIICKGCPDDFPQSAPGASAITQCYKDCSVQCIPVTCPSNSTCTQTNTMYNGTWYYGGSCDAVPQNCEIVEIICNENYYLNGTICKPCPTNTTSPAGSTSIEQCTPVLCDDGQYLNNITCENCPDGYPHSDPNATSQYQCYDNCTTPCVNPTNCPVANATCTYGANPNSGHLYYGASTCDAAALVCPVDEFTCISGYGLNSTGDGCVLCPAGTYSINGVCEPCPDGYISGAGATACEPCPAGTISNTAGTACEPCPENTYWNNGTCLPCPPGYTSVPGSTSINDCILSECPNGQHVDHGACYDDVIGCTAPHASNATRTWNPILRAYDSCQIIECISGYHIASNACVLDDQSCAVPNGRGEREWNASQSQWGACIVTECNPGFEIIGNECRECVNRRVNGEIAVSSYASECEIATCMYQGQKYALEGNECYPICENDFDETGTKHWDENTKRCVRTCNPGYKMW